MSGRVRGPRGHRFVYEEDSNGQVYGFCAACRRYESDCQANEFHPAVDCDQGGGGRRARPDLPSAIS